MGRTRSPSRSRSPSRRDKRRRSAESSSPADHNLSSHQHSETQSSSPCNRWKEEVELKLIEDEASVRIDLAIEKMVQEALDSEKVRKEVERRLQEGRKRICEEVANQIAKEREEAALEAQRREESARRQEEHLQKIREENQRKMEEAMREAAEAQARREEERYRELERLQQEKEEALRKRKLEEDQQRAEQIKILGKKNARPKLSFALGSRVQVSCGKNL